jgi:hypothetical protein
MEAKHYIFLVGLLVTVPPGAYFAARARGFRDACAFLLVFGTLRYDLLAINFVSREWYRGTSRGFEICWLDFLWMIVLASEPRRVESPGRRAGLPVCLPAMLLFVAYNALNVYISTPQIYGLFELSKMVRALLVFVTLALYVKSDRELRVIIWSLSSAVACEWVAAVLARLGGQPRTPGSFSHPNSLSMYNLMTVPVLLAVFLSDTDERLRRVCAASALLGTTSVLLTVSRSGIVNLALLLLLVGATCGPFEITLKKGVSAFLALIIVAVFLFKTSGDFERRFTEGGSEYGGKAYEGRGAYLLLAQIIVADDPRGCGLNNWSYWVTNRYGARIEQFFIPYPDPDTRPPKRKLRLNAHVDDPQAAPAHSLYAITLGETGWAGVILYGLVWLRWAQMTGSFLVNRTSALRSRFGVGVFFGMLGALSQSFTEWEIRQTPLLFMLSILLGTAAAVHPVRPGAAASRPA